MPAPHPLRLQVVALDPAGVTVLGVAADSESESVRGPDVLCRRTLDTGSLNRRGGGRAHGIPATGEMGLQAALIGLLPAAFAAVRIASAEESLAQRSLEGRAAAAGQRTAIARHQSRRSSPRSSFSPLGAPGAIAVAQNGRTAW